MNNNLSNVFLLPMRSQNFEILVQYIQRMCIALVQENTLGAKKIPNNENSIRSILVQDYLMKKRANNGMSEYLFIPEVPENYDGQGQYIGRVDIYIRLKTDFEINDAYYIVECKRLDGGITLNKQYVDEGITRFVTQKYSSFYGRNMLLGFVVKPIDIKENAKSVERLQNESSDLQMHGEWELLGEQDITISYKCLHKLCNKELDNELELRHMFADISQVI